MQNEWKVTVWGVRGSVPKAEKNYLEFGGNTACISVDCGDELVVLDAGSGLSVLGRTLTDKGDKRTITLLLGHLHLDHVMGLFSFPPFFDHEADIRIYGPPGFRKPLEFLTGPPFWPVGFSDFPAEVSFHELNPGDSFSLKKLDGYTMAGSHPGGSLLYRLETRTSDPDGKKKSITYTLDCEMEENLLPALTDFARGTDLLIWDSCFMPKDLLRGWGHSTWEQGSYLGLAAGAKKILMTHYNQNYSDSFLHMQEKQAARLDVACCFAKEGMVIQL